MQINGGLLLDAIFNISLVAAISRLSGININIDYNLAPIIDISQLFISASVSIASKGFKTIQETNGHVVMKSYSINLKKKWWLRRFNISVFSGIGQSIYAFNDRRFNLDIDLIQCKVGFGVEVLITENWMALINVGSEANFFPSIEAKYDGIEVDFASDKISGSTKIHQNDFNPTYISNDL